MVVETFDERFLQELERLLNDECDGCEGRPQSVGTGATPGRFGDINISKENWQPLSLLSSFLRWLFSHCAWWHLLRRSCNLRVFFNYLSRSNHPSESGLMATGAKLFGGAFPMSIEGWCRLSCHPKFTLQSSCGPTGTSSGTICSSSLMLLEYTFFYVQPQLRPASYEAILPNCT